VTLEDPIEYLFQSQKAFIEQRELGKHFHTYQQGLLDVLRQAPDVIVVGEMRSAETIQLSLDAAESGHLVIATMHAGSHEEAVHRMCSLTNSSSGEHTRMQLSQSLAGIVNQQLVYMPKLRHSVPLLSILRNTRAVATTIRENKLSQLDSILETGKDKGMFTFSAYRSDYLAARKDFHKPLELADIPAGSVPREFSSAIFNYNADADLRWDGVQAAASAGSAPLAPGLSEDVPVGLSSDAIEEFISELERRSA